MITVLLIVLLILAIGGAPNFGYTSGWGPSGIIGVILIVLLVLVLTGRL